MVPIFGANFLGHPVWYHDIFLSHIIVVFFKFSFLFWV